MKYWLLDFDIVEPNVPNKASTNLEPLLINTAGSWDLRPHVTVDGIPNLFLAADHVRTYTDLATMEAANEAGRRAADAILEMTGSSEEYCMVKKLSEPISQLRDCDRRDYQRGCRKSSDWERS